MQITRQADYAVRAVLCLAQLGQGARVSTAQIAQKQNIPPSFLAKIVSQLAAAGVVRATRGARGGISLARPANEINLLEIVEVIDGPMTLNECVRNPEACPFAGACTVQQVWCEAQAALILRLSQSTFGQLAGQSP